VAPFLKWNSASKRFCGTLEKEKVVSHLEWEYEKTKVVDTIID
jgi:hypothetical protein